MSRIYLILGSLAIVGSLIGASYLKGRSDGVRAEAARVILATKELNNKILLYEREAEEREASRLEQVRQLQSQIELLTNETDSDPDADRLSLPSRSVQRINSVR